MMAPHDTAARMAALVAKGEANQWHAETAFDWDQPVKLPKLLPRRAYVAAVSQLYHGEVATLEFCTRLIDVLPNDGERRALALQITDERRHADVYRAYLERVGDIAAMDDSMRRSVDAAMDWPGSYHAAIVAFHIVLESEAVRLQAEFGRWFPCPLLKQINTVVAQDEARHVAFGKIWLRRELAALDPDQRMEIFDWIKRLWHDCAGSTIDRHGVPSALLKGLGRRWLQERWQRQLRSLADIGLVPEGAA